MTRKSPVLAAIALGLTATTVVPAIFPAESLHDEIMVDEGRFFVGSPTERQEIENVGMYCLECHGGENGSSSAPAPRHEVGAAEKNHPVDVPYPDNRKGYRPAGDLDQRLSIHDGRISCLTCHAPGPERELVIPKERSELCMACHRK